MPRAIALTCGMLAGIASVFGAVAAAALGLPDQAAAYIAVAGLCSVACLGGAYWLDTRSSPAMLAFAIGTATALLAVNEATVASSGGGSARALAVALGSAGVAAAAAAIATVASVFTPPPPARR